MGTIPESRKRLLSRGDFPETQDELYFLYADELSKRMKEDASTKTMVRLCGEYMLESSPLRRKWMAFSEADHKAARALAFINMVCTVSTGGGK